MRGGFGVWPELLNKITGCESRTVPPLYVLMVRVMAKASHWGVPREGRSLPRKEQSSARHESEDLRIGFSHALRVYGVLRLSQKNGCGVYLQDAAAYLIFQEEISMKNKKMMVILVALVAVIAAMMGVFAMTRPEAVEGSKNVTVVIIHKDGTTKEMNYDTDLEFLADLLLEKELATGYTSEEYGFTVESVDGVVLDWSKDNAYWALYEGEEYATTSAAGIVLTDGGVYKLVYETF